MSNDTQTTTHSQPRAKQSNGRFVNWSAAGGMLFLGIAGTLAVRSTAFVLNGSTTDAVVIDVQRIDDEDSTTYLPTFGFQGPNGSVEASPKFAASGYDYAIGDTVEIRFDPDNPSHAVPTGALTPWLVPIVLATVGGLMLLQARQATPTASAPRNEGGPE